MWLKRSLGRWRNSLVQMIQYAISSSVVGISVSIVAPPALFTLLSSEAFCHYPWDIWISYFSTALEFLHRYSDDFYVAFLIQLDTIDKITFITSGQ